MDVLICCILDECQLIGKAGIAYISNQNDPILSFGILMLIHMIHKNTLCFFKPIDDGCPSCCSNLINFLLQFTCKMLLKNRLKHHSGLTIEGDQPNRVIRF